MASSNHALVFGASGVSGNAVTREVLAWKEPAFAKVCALTNRPLSVQDSGLPNDSRLHLASGVDLTTDVDSVIKLLQDKVSDISSVTHVFFTAYVEKPDAPSLVAVNTKLVHNAVASLDKLAPNLKSVILQTGGKHYGVEFPDAIDINPPLLETAPRIPAPYSDKIFYYTQYDEVKRLSQGKSWTFTEVRPDVIVGFTPGSNFMNIAQGVAFYLTLFKAINGAGATCPFPGTTGGYKALHNDSFADFLARVEIFAALNPDKAGNGRSFNGTNGDLVSWESKWGPICSYFGLTGAPPDPKNKKGDGVAGAFAKAHADLWHKIEKENSLRPGLFDNFSWRFVAFILESFDFDRHFDQSELRKAGFTESTDTVQGFKTTFDRMRQAKVIP